MSDVSDCVRYQYMEKLTALRPLFSPYRSLLWPSRIPPYTSGWRFPLHPKALTAVDHPGTVVGDDENMTTDEEGGGGYYDSGGEGQEM